MIKILYISYDGILEPLGQSQVLSYIEKLSGPTFKFYLVSFEKPEDRYNRIKTSVEKRVKDANIEWFPLWYRKNPPVLSSAMDILSGFRLGLKLTKIYGIDIIHARSYVAAMSAAMIKKFTGSGLLFDMRALYIDQRVDGGLWKKDGFLFKIGKKAESWLLSQSDGIVVLTEAMKKYLLDNMSEDIQPDLPFAVIPTCVDMDAFNPALFKDDEQRQTYELVYSGSLVDWYEVPTMALFFKVILENSADGRILVITRSDPSVLLGYCRELGADVSRIDITSSPHNEMPEKLSHGKAGFLILRDCLSRIGVFSTKTAEFLAMGLPVVMNAGHPDKDRLIMENRIGVLMDTTDEEGCRKAVSELLQLQQDPELPARCRKTAGKQLSLDTGVKLYTDIYKNTLIHRNLREHEK